MFFELSKIFWTIFAPLNILCICLFFSLFIPLFVRGGGGKALRNIVILLLLAGILPIGHDSLTFLENRFEKPKDMPAKVDGVILLGGAVSSELSHMRQEPVIGENGARLFAFMQLARQYPQARLVITGGSGSLFDQEHKEADYVKELFLSLGLRGRRVIYEPEARNTHENARFVREIVTNSSSETWLIVTSAYHMPRSIGAFRKEGIYPIAYPVGYLTSGEYHYVPRDFNVLNQYRYLHTALKEYIGNIAYYIGQKSNSLMPRQQ